MTHSPAPRQRRNILRNEDGVALPISLFGLIMVTILITAVILTSSTELAVSGAHQDAQRGLYTAEDGIDVYLADLRAALPTMTFLPRSQVITIALGDGRSAEVTVARFDSVPPVGTTPGYQIYSIRSRSLNGGGREVAAMYRVTLPAGGVRDTLSVEYVQAAATFGGNVAQHGSMKISGSPISSRCGMTKTAKAVQVSDQGGWNAKLAEEAAKTSGDIRGGLEKTTETKDQMRQRMLGNLNIRDMAARADIKFGFDGQTVFNQSRTVTTDSIRASRYNWGCPHVLGDCSHQSVGGARDSTYYPVVAIDAQGGRVILEKGKHGQGILIVYNGNVQFKGTWFYKGFIIAENALDVDGTLKVDGAIYAAGTVNVGTPDNTSDLQGSLEINFDPCALQKVMSEFNKKIPVPPPTTAGALDGRPYGWFEVVR